MAVKNRNTQRGGAGGGSAGEMVVEGAKNAEKKVEEALTVLLHELREYPFLLTVMMVAKNQPSTMDAVSVYPLYLSLPLEITEPDSRYASETTTL